MYATLEILALEYTYENSMYTYTVDEKLWRTNVRLMSLHAKCFMTYEHPGLLHGSSDQRTLMNMTSWLGC